MVSFLLARDPLKYLRPILFCKDDYADIEFVTEHKSPDRIARATGIRLDLGQLCEVDYRVDVSGLELGVERDTVHSHVVSIPVAASRVSCRSNQYPLSLLLCRRCSPTHLLPVPILAQLHSPLGRR